METYVRQDEHGVLRVGDTRVMLDSVLAAFMEGHSAETIQSQYPSLRLEEVYGAIAYCLRHGDEVSVYLGRQDAVWEQWRRRAARDSAAVVERLRALQHASLSEQR
jgi:uncharacterized protein (DUF433 family)